MTASPAEDVDLAAAARGLADQQGDDVAAAAAAGTPVTATVSTVTAGGASDGNALVTVTYRGVVTTAAGYLNSYTPVAGNRVLAVFVDHQLLILGRLIGHP